MSRNGGGLRRDLQVLKRLKEASANPSSLLHSGDALLEKANKIKGFLNQQKSRTTAASGKSEWLLVHQHLQEERDTCERELHACLTQLLEGSAPDLASEAKDWLASCKASSDDCRMLRRELKLQVKGISKVVGSLRAYGPKSAGKDFAGQCSALDQEVRLLREDLDLQLRQLAEEADRLASELASLAPSALAGSTTLGGGIGSIGAAGALGGTGPPRAPGAAGPGAGPRAAAGAAASSSAPPLQGGDEALPGKAASASDGGDVAERPPEEEHACGYNVGRDALELEALLGRYTLAEESVKQSIREVHRALQERFLEKLATWRVEWEASGLAATKAGWSPVEQSQFSKLRDRYYKDGLSKGAGKGGRQAALTKIAQLLPGRTLQELMVYDDLFVASKLLQRRRRDAVEAWGRERRCFLEDSECFLAESARANAAAAAAAADRLVHELQREQYREELDEKRAAKQAEWEAGADARAAAEVEARERAQAEAERLEAEKAVRKEMIAAYRAELDLQLQQEQAAREAEEHAQSLIRAQQAEVNKERVEWRHAEYQVKVEKQQESLKAHAEEQEAQRQRLERLRALVAPHVEADPDRVKAPTAAYSAAVAAAEEERDMVGAAAFKPVHGYNVVQMYKDPRFKLMDALQRQGLQNTDYARHVMMHTRAAKPTRPDNLTHMQRAPPGT